jgi:hypothetical protein
LNNGFLFGIGKPTRVGWKIASRSSASASMPKGCLWDIVQFSCRSDAEFRIVLDGFEG